MGAAAGLTESIFAIKSMQTGEIPAIKNLETLENNNLNYA